ncbi:hypothetical protein SCHPADRAFT_1002045 [Schizopora paradoxa]|uniref:UBA domain-containing protein n=1 Tax=Schizopora paradoxa TaxID=27342 RepID=A0A0H2R6G4_9AGAM|nr:hypothetical protein SCHPADRAFT_1002045 [Schizopora paradoxa]
MPSDSFADLWNSSAPSSSSAASTKPQTLASQSSASLSTLNSNGGGGGGSRPGSRLDAFSLLAATTSSSSSPKPSSQTGSRAITPSLSTSKQQPLSATKGAGGSAGSDAFSSLLGSTFAARKDASSSMSLADRQQQQAQRSQTASTLSTGSKGDGVWDGLDMLGSSSSAKTSTAKAHQHVEEDEDDWGFGLGVPTSKSATAPATAKSAIDEPQPRKASEDNDLFDFLSSSDSRPSVQRSSPPQPQAPPQLDRSESLTFDPFEKFNVAPSLPQTTSTSTSTLQSAAGQTSNDDNNNDPGDFDFGDREYRERGADGGQGYGDDGDDDEILGILGSKPSSSRRRAGEAGLDINERPSPLPRSSLPTTTGTRTTKNSGTSSSSPPPHIIGQIVEMGFSPQQARVALAATETGVDVQLALEMLLSNGVGGSGGEDSSPPSAPSSQQQRERERTRPRPSRHGSQRQEQDRTQTPSGAPGGTGAGTSGVDLQEKADKLLAQASELGMNVFSRAGALWKEGKARAQRVYEEGIAANANANAASGTSSPTPDSGAGRRRGAQMGEQQSGSAGGGGSGGGRPKWMTGEGEFGDELELENHANANGGGFRDHDDDEDGGVGAAVPQEPPIPPPRRQPKPKETETINLFGADEPTTYVSPARRRGAGAASSSSKSSTTHPPSAPSSQRQPPPPPPRQTQQPQRRAPTPPTPSRPLITASPASLTSSNSHKTKGTELFKLGRYAEAVSAYTAALAPLPEKHLLRVPILNNRALARMRCGEYGGARGDCDEVLEIIGSDYRPENDITNNGRGNRGGEAEGANVDLREGWLKARRRRAEASEARERWGEALGDWEVLAGCAWKGVGAGVRREALAGVGRCKKGLAVANDSSEASKVSTKGTGTTSVSEDFDILATPSPSPQAPASSNTKSDSNSNLTMTTKPKPKPKPIPLSPRAQSTIASAVAAARHASQLEEAEALARHSLKDRVDSRLLSWKAGKEGNLRALLATLDSVLWEELGWVRCGMHELVTERQVKVRYTRAIGKVHPDKLNAANTTLEQRMIANGVFGALNEAWVAHKG